MPRLPFVVSEPDDTIVEVVAPLARLQAWAVKAPAETVMHRPPTALKEPDSGPVRNVDGLVLHRIRVSDARELTCTECGDVAIAGKCWHCGNGMDPVATPMVPTVSYLNPDEYEFIRRTW